MILNDTYLLKSFQDTLASYLLQFPRPISWSSVALSCNFHCINVLIHLVTCVDEQLSIATRRANNKQYFLTLLRTLKTLPKSPAPISSSLTKAWSK